MEKKSKVLLIAIIILLASSIGLAFYRSVILGDINVIDSEGVTPSELGSESEE